MKDLEKLWALTGEKRAGYDEEWNQYFEPVGLILLAAVEKWQDGGSPRTALTFAQTGGDSVHFSFLCLADRPADQCPVVMTMPCAEEPNLVLGENLREFLGLGCRGGYFTLEQLEYTPEEQIPFLESQAYEAETDDEQIVLLKQIETHFALSPPRNVAGRLAELKKKYGHLLA